MKHVKTIAASLLLGVLAASAHAEGNYSNMKFDFLIYGMVALAVMAAQGIYVLCIGPAGIGTRLLRLLALAVVDVIAIFLMYLMTFEFDAANPEKMGAYIWVVMPGFLFMLALHAYINRKDNA